MASFLNDASSEMIFPLLPLFLVGTLGAGPAFLGIIEGVAETTASFLKLAGGWISDRLGRRRALVAGGYGIAAATRPLMALATLPWHVLVIRFTDRIGKGIRTAPRDALLAESADSTRRGRAFGIHRAADHAGAVLGPLLAAGILLLAPGNIRLVFRLAALPAVLADQFGLADTAIDIMSDDNSGRDAVATTIPIKGTLDQPDVRRILDADPYRRLTVGHA